MPGVVGVKADARKGRVEITYEPGTTSPDTLRHTLEEIGFPVVG